MRYTQIRTLIVAGSKDINI